MENIRPFKIVLSFAGLLAVLTVKPLWAFGKQYSQMGNRGQSPQQEVDLMGLMIALGGVLLLAFIAWGFSYWQKRRESLILNSPRGLFRELCGAHGLTRADRDLLYEIAQWHEIADPVQLFVEPHRFRPAEMYQALDCESEAQELESRLFTKEKETVS